MIYNEEYVSRAYTVEQLIYILSTELPGDADIETAVAEHSLSVEVWYDKDTNTVILK